MSCLIWRVPEWLGTGLENLGGVTAYRVRFPGPPPVKIIVADANIGGVKCKIFIQSLNLVKVAKSSLANSVVAAPMAEGHLQHLYK